MNPDGTVELLAAILTGTPSLPGAACRRRPGLFDDRHPGETTEQQRQRFEAAAAVCRSCPAQLACRSAMTVSRWNGVGVQAGQVLAGPIRIPTSELGAFGCPMPVDPVGSRCHASASAPACVEV